MEAISTSAQTSTKSSVKLATPRKVKQAFFHAAIMWPQHIGSEVNLQSHKFPGLKMLWIPGDGLLLEQGGDTFTVAPANIIGVVHD